MKMRGFKCEEVLWEKIRRKAYENGITSSEVIRLALEEYLTGSGLTSVPSKVKVKRVKEDPLPSSPKKRKVLVPKSEEELEESKPNWMSNFNRYMESKKKV